MDGQAETNMLPTFSKSGHKKERPNGQDALCIAYKLTVTYRMDNNEYKAILLRYSIKLFHAISQNSRSNAMSRSETLRLYFYLKYDGHSSRIYFGNNRLRHSHLTVHLVVLENLR